MKNLCIIPAKDQSRRLPGKNLREVGGRSLLGRAIDVGKDLWRLGLVDFIVVSTDGGLIQHVASEESVGAHWRAAAVRDDPNATVRDVCVDLLLTRNDSDLNHLCNRPCRDWHGELWDLVLVLVPTAPLRTARTVGATYWLMAQHGFNHPALTAVRARKAPRLMLAHTVDGLWRVPWPAAGGDWFVHEGSAIWTKPEWLRKDKGFYDRPCLIQEVPPEEAVDVDTELDLVIAEALLRRTAP